MVKHLTFTLLLLGCLAAAQDRYRIQTFAGTPAPEGVPATSSFLSGPQGLALDSAGNLYVGVVNQWRVKRIDANTTNINTVAGSGLYGYSGDNGPALQAGFYVTRYVALNTVGDLFISDNMGCVVRKVDHVTKVITTYAGNGSCGYSGDNGQATSAQLNAQRGIALDSAGNLYIADVSNQRVRRVDAVTHIITTVAGADPSTNPPYDGDGHLATNAGLRSPYGVALDSGGDLYIIDKNNCAIRRVNLGTNIIGPYAGKGPGFCGYDGDGGPATAAMLSNNVRAIAFGPGDNLYLSDSASLRVRVVLRNGSDPGNIYPYAGDGTYGYQGVSTPATSAHLAAPEGLAVDSNGDLYIADFNANAIGKITHGATPMFSLYAGSLGPEGVATSAFLNRPEDMAVTPGGDVLINESATGRVRDVNTSGLISTLAGAGITGPYHSCSVPLNCFLGSPMGLAVDNAGSYLFSEYTNCVIRKVDSSNNMTTVAGTGVCGYDSDVGPATSVRLGSVGGISVASAFNPANGTAPGDIFLADYGNNRLRVILASDGEIHPIAGGSVRGYNGENVPINKAQLNGPYGVAIDPTSSVLYFAEIIGSRVRKVDATTLLISTVAGTGVDGYNGDGVAASVQLSSPSDVWVNPAGDLFIADPGNSLVRRIPAGTNQLITIAGNHALGPGYSGDGGPATSAQLFSPDHITGDALGRLYVSDTVTNVVRLLTPQYLLTTSVKPTRGGTITPGGYFDQGTIVPVSAAANPSFKFTGFSGAATGSVSPVNVTMSSTRTVVANFSVLNPAIQGAITAKANGPLTQERDYTLRLTNAGSGAGTACMVTTVNLVRRSGSGQGRATLLTALPVVYGNLGIGAQVSKVIRTTVSTNVQRLDLIAGGSCQNMLGQAVPFSTTISVTR